MWKINKKSVLFFIFLFVLLVKLYFVFQSPYFHRDAYLNRRYVENILNSGEHLRYDELSYNGREIVYSPMYHYILAFFSLIFPIDYVLKILPAIFSSLVVFVVYFLVKEIVEDEKVALFMALSSGFVPIFFVKTLNNISIFSLALPVLFYLVYLLIRMDETRDVKKFVFFSFFLALLHPIAFLFLISLVFYLILVASENIRLSKLKLEVIWFCIFLILFVEFFCYKKAFLEYGLGVIWNNVPEQVLANYFDFSFLEAIYKVGVMGIIFGFIGLSFVFVKKREKLFLLGSLIFSNLLLLWLRLIDVGVGLMFLGIALIVMSSLFLKGLFLYFEKTKIASYRNLFCFFVLSFFVLSLVVPSLIDASHSLKEIPDGYEILVLEWIKENSLPGVSVLAPIEYGHLITDIARRRNVIDNNFLLARDSSKVYKDVKDFYSSKFEVDALNLINRYNVDYVFIPVDIEMEQGGFKWLDDKNCFKGIFFGTPKVYEITC